LTRCETGIHHADIAADYDDGAAKTARRDFITLTLTLTTTMAL
jgi:hypothetical protein